MIAAFAPGQSAIIPVAANSVDTEKARISTLLGEHEYPAALEAAQALNKQDPDDVMVYGLLTDANIELGNYRDAEISAQWMLNLRPGNLPALLRAARLRELFGDPEGAYELTELAYQSTSPADTEQRPAILTQMAHLRLATGNVDAADKLLQQTLTDFPGYSPASVELAQVRIAQKRYQDAVVLLQQRYQSAPHPESLYQLAEALQQAGRAADAQKAFQEFETKALANSAKKDNSNRELIFYYADRAHQPAKALMLAQQEIAWRHDVYTLDAYAWALHVNSQDAEARKQIETALAVGIRDPKLLLHAGAITQSLGDIPAAENYLTQAAELNGAESHARTASASIKSAQH
jgi:tetratricopeptide (TPR) repeat protein